MAFILATAITLSPMADVPQDDQRLFAQILSAEAGHDWEYEGYMLLAHAVMNQVGTEGNTLREVLTKPGNFTVYENGRYLSVPVTTRAELAVRLVTAGITAHDHGQRCQHDLYGRGEPRQLHHHCHPGGSPQYARHHQFDSGESRYRDRHPVRQPRCGPHSGPCDPYP